MNSRRLRYSWLIVITLLAVLLPSIASASSPPQWSEPELAPTGMPSSWFPDQYADAAGNVFAIWEATRDIDDPGVTDANGGAIMFSQYGADGWSVPADIYVKDIYNAARPIIVSDGVNVHVIARALRNGVSTPSLQNLAGLYYMRAPLSSDLHNVHSWSQPILLSRTDAAAYWAQIAVLPDGTLLAVYNELHDTVVDGQKERRPVLFSRRSMDHGLSWSVPVRVSTSANPVARTSLSASPDGRFLVLAWDEGYDNLTGTGEPSGIFTAVSEDGGEKWQSHQRLAGGDPITRQTSYAERGLVEQSLVVTNGQTTVIVYRSTVGSGLLFRVSGNGGHTWSDESVIPDSIARPYPGPHNFEKLSAAFDSDGRLLLTYVGFANERTEDLSVMLTTYANGLWTRPEQVASPDGFPEYPRISVALGNQVHITYFVRDQQFIDNGAYQIWQAKGSSDAPPIAPVVASPYALPTTGSQPTVPEVPEVQVEIAPHVARPEPPERLPADRMTPYTPETLIKEPILRATIATIAVLGACCLVYLFTRLLRGLRI